MPGIKSITGAIGKGVSAVGAAGAFVSSSDAEKGQMLGGAIAGAFKRKVGYKTGDPKKIGGTEGEEGHSHDENLKETTFKGFEVSLFKYMGAIVSGSKKELSSLKNQERAAKEGRAESRMKNLLKGFKDSMFKRDGAEKKEKGINWWKVLLFGAGAAGIGIAAWFGVEKMLKMYEDYQKKMKGLDKASKDVNEFFKDPWKAMFGPEGKKLEKEITTQLEEERQEEGTVGGEVESTEEDITTQLAEAQEEAFQEGEEERRELAEMEDEGGEESSDTEVDKMIADLKTAEATESAEAIGGETTETEIASLLKDAEKEQKAVDAKAKKLQLEEKRQEEGTVGGEVASTEGDIRTMIAQAKAGTPEKVNLGEESDDTAKRAEDAEETAKNVERIDKIKAKSEGDQLKRQQEFSDVSKKLRDQVAQDEDVDFVPTTTSQAIPTTMPLGDRQLTSSEVDMGAAISTETPQIGGATDFATMPTTNAEKLPVATGGGTATMPSGAGSGRAPGKMLASNLGGGDSTQQAAGTPSVSSGGQSGGAVSPSGSPGSGGGVSSTPAPVPEIAAASTSYDSAGGSGPKITAMPTLQNQRQIASKEDQGQGAAARDAKKTARINSILAEGSRNPESTLARAKVRQSSYMV